VKEGKVGFKDGRPLPAQDEPLHAYITSSSSENVKKAVDKVPMTYCTLAGDSVEKPTTSCKVAGDIVKAISKVSATEHKLMGKMLRYPLTLLMGGPYL